MKKYLILFMALLSVLSFWSLYNETSRNEFRRIRDLEAGIAESFRIPDEPYLSVPEVIYPLLLETAQELGVNIFRSSQTSAEEVNKFILLTNKTAFWNELSLRSGTIFTNEEAQSGHQFLSTARTGNENQVGQIVYFGNQEKVTIAPLITAFESLVVAGRYFAELPTGVSLEDFLASLTQNINERFDFLPEYQFTVDEFLDSDIQNSMELFDLGWENQLLILMAFATLIMGIYYAVSQGKKISIMKLNGLKTMSIWRLVVGKLVLSTMGVISGLLLVLALSLSLYFRNFEFLKAIAMRQLLIFGVIFLVSLGVCFMIKRIAIGLGIKNKNSTGFVFWFNTLIKCGLTVVVLISGFVALSMYDDIRKQEQLLTGWSKSNDYGVFFPLMGGNDEPGDSMRDIAMWEGLYPVLNEMGSLLISANHYTEWDLDVNGMGGGDINRVSNGIIESWRHVRVNPNYLQAFPVLDVNGEVITISDDDDRLILLLPESYKADEEELLAHFKQRREDAIGITENWYGLEVSETARNSALYIVWTQSNQEIFSFNPEVFPENNNYIVDPIMRVVTMANSVAVEREIILGGGASDPMKVALIDGDIQQTFETLSPILRELGLDDNLPHLVTVNESALEVISQLRNTANVLVAVMVLISMIAVSLSLQNTVLFFRQHRQKFVIKRVFGAGFLKTYGKYFYYLGALWVIQIPLAIMGVQLNDMGFDVHVSWFVILLFLGIEATLSILMIQAMENKNKLAVLKGEG